MSHFYKSLRQVDACSSSSRNWLAGVLAASLFLFGLSVSAQTVTILEPIPNASVSTSIRVRATVSDTSSILTTKIYLDGVSVYSSGKSGLDTTISVTQGTHRIAVQAYDSAGRNGKSVVYVTASATAPTTTDLTTFTRIEEQTEWTTCGSCGNTGGTGAVASYSMTRGISSPSKDGSSAKFWIGGSYAYKNAYWYIHQKAPAAPVKYLKYEFDLYVPAASATAPQAIEFECQQKANGYIYNFAWQANYAGGTWRIFDYVNRRWDYGGLNLTKFSPNTWHHIVSEFHTEGTTVVHDALTIDGVRHAIGIKHAAKYVGGTSKSFTNAFQLDLNKTATDYSVLVDGMKVSYK
jgi:hypothetical protein